jgi:acyl carrier protein
MEFNERIVHLIFEVIDELNERLPKEQQLAKSVDTPLFGRDSVLDSLGFVNLIVAMEDKVEEQFDKAVVLADERALQKAASPFRTVGTLADYICELLASSDID